MTEYTDDQRAEVLLWLAETGYGYKRASKHFGIPRATIQVWAQSARAGSTAARGRPPKPPDPVPPADPAEPPSPDDEPDWDPVDCTREQFLAAGIRRCQERARKADNQGHGGVARQWEITAGAYRDELDKLREELRRKAGEQVPLENVDPGKVARRLLRSIPRLAKLAPDLAREVYRDLGRAIGEWEEMPGDHAEA